MSVDCQALFEIFSRSLFQTFPTRAHVRYNAMDG